MEIRETDEQLYSSFLKSGDSRDLEKLLERHRESLTLFLYGFVHDMEDSEELMMDAFAVLLSKAPGFSGKSSFKTWLFAVGRNLALKHLRKMRRIPGPVEYEKAETQSRDTGPETKILKDEQSRQLYAALEKLNPEYRQVLHLIYIDGMSSEEASLVMKKTKKQVYNLTARGKAMLKEELEKMGFDQ